MSRVPPSDGIVAGDKTKRPPRFTGFGARLRMRVSATVTLSGNMDRARAERDLVNETMREAARTLQAHGIEIEIVVGKPRSPESLRATLLSLTDATELEEQVA